MDASESNLHEDIIGNILLFLPVGYLYRFSLVNKHWMNKALDRDGLIASVPHSKALRLSRLRPRVMALMLPNESDEHCSEIMDAYCSMVQNVTSVEITTEDDAEFNREDYEKLCAAMKNVHTLVLGSLNLSEITHFSLFPHLKCLQMIVMDDELDDIVDSLIGNCPKLEILHFVMNTDAMEKLEDLVVRLKPMKNLKELLVDDPPRDSRHAVELLTGVAEPSPDAIIRSLDSLKLACPVSLHPSRIFITSIPSIVRYDAVESLPVLLLPFVPESFLGTFTANFLDANAKSTQRSYSPAISCQFASLDCALTPARTATTCMNILLAAGLDLFHTSCSILHEFVKLHASQALAHVIDYIQRRHPGRLVELLYDSRGFSPLHFLNIFPSGTCEGTEEVVKCFRSLGDLSTFLNDSNNSEGATAVARFVNHSCALLSQVRRSESIFVEIMKLLNNSPLPERTLQRLTQLVAPSSLTCSWLKKAP
eukprot:TRINITY_DN14167_c0_g1_i1.p1 TRINITY_DN14167_c0_g1~~TRINITY_DN14167_c0_g1_i1.p1  ORF type:complete len:480 (+),score=41.87 TRINITY_DN14167_c0_g1_i1:498-1937(+)